MFLVLRFSGLVLSGLSLIMALGYILVWPNKRLLAGISITFALGVVLVLATIYPMSGL